MSIKTFITSGPGFGIYKLLEIDCYPYVSKELLFPIVPQAQGKSPYQTHYIRMRCVLRAPVQFCLLGKADATSEV